MQPHPLGNIFWGKIWTNLGKIRETLGTNLSEIWANMGEIYSQLYSSKFTYRIETNAYKA